MPSSDNATLEPVTAIEKLNQARALVEQNPTQGSAWHYLAQLTAESGDYAAAIQHHERAVSLEPENPNFHLGMGNTYAFSGDNLRAIECYGTVLRLRPDSGVAWNNLGNLFLRLKDVSNALLCYQNATRFQPDDSSFHYNLGRTLDSVGRHAEARDALLRARDLNPNHEDTWTNLGNAYQHLGEYELALSCYDSALKISANPAELHVNRAVVLLNTGNFKEGWREYEYRWETAAFEVYKRRSFGKPQWKGESLVGKRILLHAEQGFGDAIQFARFLPQVAARGAEIFLEVGAPLSSLMESLIDRHHIVVRGQSLPEFDYHCSLISLPFVLGIEIDSIPNKPYLAIPPDALEEGKRAIEQLTKGQPRLRIGLCWRGNPTHRWDHLRSLKPQQLRPLASLSAVQWFLLQRDITPEELGAFPAELSYSTVPADHLDGFQRIAALMQNLDLIVSVDTATAHLAGALGRPLCLLVPKFYEWRWHTHLQNSPWYLSARLFRPAEAGAWQSAMEHLTSYLASAAAKRATLP